MPLFSLLPIPDCALVVLTFVWGIIGWAFMAPQQSRIVALDPASQNVSLSLNASAIYVGAAIGSAVGGTIIERPRVRRARLGVGPRARRGARPYPADGLAGLAQESAPSGRDSGAAE